MKFVRLPRHVKELHYAWVMLGVAIAMRLISSVERTASGVLLAYLVDPAGEFGWNRSVVGLALSLQWICSGVFAPPAPRQQSPPEQPQPRWLPGRRPGRALRRGPVAGRLPTGLARRGGGRPGPALARPAPGGQRGAGGPPPGVGTSGRRVAGGGRTRAGGPA